MKFICDVHISFKLVRRLNSLGFPTLHVNDLPGKWYTTDREISAYSDLHDLILITKDYDFKNSFFLQKTPRKLIKINLGNVSNSDLLKIVCDNLEAIQKLNLAHRFLVEIERDFTVFIKEED